MCPSCPLGDLIFSQNTPVHRPSHLSQVSSEVWVPHFSNPAPELSLNYFSSLLHALHTLPTTTGRGEACQRSQGQSWGLPSPATVGPRARCYSPAFSECHCKICEWHFSLSIFLPRRTRRWRSVKEEKEEGKAGQRMKIKNDVTRSQHLVDLGKMYGYNCIMAINKPFRAH